MVPQYVRGEEHVSTFIPPFPPAPITFAPRLSHETYEPEIQTPTQAQLHYPSGHIHQPQPLVPIRPISEYQSPPSPAPDASTFEAPTWDPSR